MVSNLHIGTISESNIVIVGDSNNWWYDYGASVHVCNNKAHFKEYKEVDNGIVVSVGNHNAAKALRTRGVEL